MDMFSSCKICTLDLITVEHPILCVESIFCYNIYYTFKAYKYNNYCFI